MEDDSELESQRAYLGNPNLSYYTAIAGEFLAEHGWFLIFAVMGMIFLFQQLSRRRASWSSPTPEPDPGTVVRRQEALEAARRRMQEELDAKAALFREKQQQDPREAEASTSVLKPKMDKKSLRSNDYNPLSGGGGGTCSFRPGRRGPSAG